MSSGCAQHEWSNETGDSTETHEMNVFYLIVGIAALALVIADQLATTLWVDGGAGPLSSRVTTSLWHGLRKMSSSHRSRLLSMAGPIILVTTLLTWVLLLWAGWTLVFAASEEAIINTTGKEALTWAGRIYFVAYTIFTLGIGDYIPANGLWQIITSIATGSGMLLITLSVSYVVSVVGAVVHKRAFARSVTGIGNSATAVIERAWDGDSFHPLDSLLSTVAPRLGTLVEQHKAYPILHYYHSEESVDASAVAVVILDEALTLLAYGIPEQHQANTVLVEQTRSSIESYLGTLQSVYIHPADRSPPPPDLDSLRASGLPVVSDEAFTDALESLEDRRRKLLGLIEADVWQWSLVQS